MTRAAVRAAVALIAAAALAGAAGAAGQTPPAGPQISRSTDGVAGRTVIAWAAPFARFQVERARLSDCSRGQRGLVFFIPGSTGRNARTSCTVPASQPIMVSPAAITCTVPKRGFCTDPARTNDVRRARITIDGKPVPVRQFDWVSRQAFRMKGQHASVGGYMYIVRGLAPGQHTIVASATFLDPTERFRTTASVTVQ